MKTGRNDLFIKRIACCSDHITNDILLAIEGGGQRVFCDTYVLGFLV